jgi:DNA-binding NarL/FixJ family response regulator
LYQESLVIFRQVGDEWRSAWALHGLGWCAFIFGQQEEAWQLQQESLATFRVLGDRWGSIWPLNSLGDWAIQRGDYYQARRLFEEGLAINQEIGDQAGIAWSLGRLSLTADSLHEADHFRKYLIKTLKATLQVNLSQERAVELFAFCNCDLDLSSQSLISMKAVHQLDTLKAELPPHVFAAAVQRGETRDIETVVAVLSEILSTLERQTDSPGFGAGDQPLTERELEILQLIADGFSNREIADHLFLALSTVKWHINQIYTKLHANSRSQAIARARALRLLA